MMEFDSIFVQIAAVLGLAAVGGWPSPAITRAASPYSDTAREAADRLLVEETSKPLAGGAT